MLSPVQRWFQFGGITLLALLLGWQVGVQREHARLVREGWMAPEVQAQDSALSALTGSGAVTEHPESDADLRLMWRVWHLLLDNYVDPGKLQTQKLVRGATAGLVKAVGDPYTLLMDPQENDNFRDGLSGTLEGIGAELIDRDGEIVVVMPIKGSPAQRAGLLPDDVILNVNGESTEGMTLQDVVSKIRGPKDTSVQLEVARAKSRDFLAFTIVRDEIHIPSVESKTIPVKDGEIGYVSLNQFGDSSIDELRQVFQSFQDQKVKSIILDLRYNGGGYLDGAVDLVSMFLKEGKVVSVQHRSGDPENHFVSGSPLFPDIPFAILVNEGTASASEITAGALQDYGRATIVGQKTFGKGTVQEVIDLPDGSSLRVTVAHWLTPKGKDLGKEGVHPDIVVDRTKEDIDAKRDPQLDAAVEFLTTGKKPEAKSSSSSSISSR